MKRGLRRKLIGCVVFVTTGAVVNVLVSTAIVLWAPMPPPAEFTVASLDGWPGRTPDHWPAPNVRYHRGNPFLSHEYVLHRPSSADVWPEDPTGVYLTSEVIRVGWPFHSLRAWRNTERHGMRSATPSAWRGGLSLPAGAVARVGGRRSGPLPYEPSWGALLANTVILAVLVWLAASVVRGVWRRLVAHPPGHCSRCGYALTGLPDSRCPECGEGGS